MMSNPNSATARKVLRSLQLQLERVANERLFHNASVDKNSRLQAAKLAASSILTKLQRGAHINNFNVQAREGEDGKIQCNVQVQPTQVAQFVTVVVSLEMMANGFFYVKRIDGEWHLCTERDIYDPSYEPVVVQFGEVEEEWTIHTKEAVIKQGVPLDDIRVWASNRQLKHLCVTCKVKSGIVRTDMGLRAGIHCQSCWDEIVFESRQRSW